MYSISKEALERLQSIYDAEVNREDIKNPFRLFPFIDVDIVAESGDYKDLVIKSYDIDYTGFHDVQSLDIEVKIVSGVIVDARIKGYSECGKGYFFIVDEDDNCYEIIIDKENHVVQRDAYGLVKRYEVFLDTLWSA